MHVRVFWWGSGLFLFGPALPTAFYLDLRLEARTYTHAHAHMKMRCLQILRNYPVKTSFYMFSAANAVGTVVALGMFLCFFVAVDFDISNQIERMHSDKYSAPVPKNTRENQFSGLNAARPVIWAAICLAVVSVLCEFIGIGAIGRLISQTSFASVPKSLVLVMMLPYLRFLVLVFAVSFTPQIFILMAGLWYWPTLYVFVEAMNCVFKYAHTVIISRWVKELGESSEFTFFPRLRSTIKIIDGLIDVSGIKEESTGAAA